MDNDARPLRDTGLDFAQRGRSIVREIAGALARVVWAIVRIPALAVLVVLEPLICGVLWLAATFGIFGALFFHFLVHDPRFPFWPALGLSVAMALLAAAYLGLMRWLGGSNE